MMIGILFLSQIILNSLHADDRLVRVYECEARCNAEYTDGYYSYSIELSAFARSFSSVIDAEYALPFACRTNAIRFGEIRNLTLESATVLNAECSSREVLRSQIYYRGSENPQG